MNIIDIEVNPYGFIRGRDALIIENLKWDSSLILELKVNASVDSFTNKVNFKEDEIELIFSFEEVYMFRVSELEMKGLMNLEEIDMFLNSKKNTIFNEIIDSKIVLENAQYSRDVTLRHFVLNTYDFKVEILSQSFVVKRG